jgi:glycosyltransferase involved in cell wall biosynthesis
VTGLISVILTTYQREDALDAVLRALSRQTDRAFEVIVADDGSGPPTHAVVERRAAQADIPIRHVWQEDRGFRLAEIRNRAIRVSSGTYCIILDGDCIPRPHFIAVHRRLAEPGWFVTGNRILMSRELTERVLAEASEAECFGLQDWIALRRRGKINRLAPLLSLPLGPLRKLRSRAWRGARACNLALWRRDLDRVDGFDATYNGWGLEDSDLLIRLLRAGIRRKDGNFATGVLHLWHAENDRSLLPDNQSRLDAIMAADRVRSIVGISALQT